MTKVYIVEEYTWDHHENVGVFASHEKAEEFCNTAYGPRETVQEDWKTRSYSYYIHEYDVIE